MKLNKDELLVYAITESNKSDKELYMQVEKALKGGATIIQLREKRLDEKAFIKRAVELKKLCHSYKVKLIINDNLKVALQSGADGVHVGKEDLPVKKIRQTAGDDFIIGATAKTVPDALNAEKDGANYLGVGAVFESSTKKNAVRITAQQLKQISSSVNIPSVAIGGITEENMGQLCFAGMSGFAFVSEIFRAGDIEAKVARLKQKALSIIKD